MKRIERILKKQAEAVLPDENFKQSVRARAFGDERVFDEVVEPVLSPAAAGAASGAATDSRNAGRRRVATIMLVVFAAIVIGLSFYFVFATTTVTASEFTYVSLDINPSFGISVASDDTVAEATALNSDAAVVLYGMDLVGMPVDAAVQAIVAECAALGFIDGTESRTLDLLAVNDSAEREAAVSNSIIDGLLAMFTQNGWNTGVHCGNISAASSADDTRYTYRANEYCSPGKTVLLAAVAEMTGKRAAAYASYSAEELNKLLKNYDETAITAVESALSAKYEGSAVQSDAEKLAEKQQSLRDFADSLGKALDMLDIDEDDFDILDLPVLLDAILLEIHNDYVDLADAIRLLYDEVHDSFVDGDWFEEFFEGLEDLFDDIIELCEEEVRDFATVVSREMSEWKADMLKELRED